MTRPPRLGGGLRIAHVGIVRHVGGRGIDRFGSAVRKLVGGDLGVLHAHALRIGGIGRLAVVAGFVLLVLLVALFAFLLVGFAAAVFAHVEIVEQIVHHVAEPALIEQHALQTIEIAPGAILDQRPPQIDELSRGGRRRFAGKPFAHQHGERIFDRRIGAIGDLVELAAMETIVEHRREIAGDAVHALGADRLDARLLDGLEHRARLLPARRQLAMHGRIVTRHLERDGVGMAAHDRGLLARELARRLRQPRLAADEPRPLGRVGDFKLAIARDRAQAAGDRALERLGRRFLGRALGLDVRGHRVAISSARR